MFRGGEFWLPKCLAYSVGGEDKGKCDEFVKSASSEYQNARQ
jgi:hypothetical protein